MASNDVPRVVVGTDGSASGEVALRYALFEAARRGARVTVVSVWEPPEDPREDYGPRRYDATSLDAGHERLAHEHVRLVASESMAGEVPIEVHVRSGPPADILIEAARDAVLLVVGHGGHSGPRSVTLGPVALRCVLHAPCAVLVVPPVAPPDLRDSTGTSGNVLPLTRPRRPPEGPG